MRDATPPRAEAVGVPFPYHSTILSPVGMEELATGHTALLRGRRSSEAIGRRECRSESRMRRGLRSLEAVTKLRLAS